MILNVEVLTRGNASQDEADSRGGEEGLLKKLCGRGEEEESKVGPFKCTVKNPSGNGS